MPDKDEFDLLLDSALSNYADPGPDFEQRIVDGVLGAGQTPPSTAVSSAPRRRLIWWSWGLAVPVLAGLILLSILPHYRTHLPAGNSPVESRSRQSASAKAPFHPPAERNQKPARQMMQPPLHAPKAAATVAPVATPKLEVFPTPEPLTPQEHALALFAANAPESEREAVLKAQNQVDAPISIAAIRIPQVTALEPGVN